LRVAEKIRDGTVIGTTLRRIYATPAATVEKLRGILAR
jgi:hypothetical protein